MKLWIDESNGKSFFVSVPTINKDEDLSFDWTSKGNRILLQKLVGKNVKPPKNRKPDGEWDTLVIDNGQLVEKQHNVWYDFGKNDLVDGGNWLQIAEWPLDNSVATRMLELAYVISKEQNNLFKVKNEVKELEEIVRQEVKQRSIHLKV